MSEPWKEGGRVLVLPPHPSAGEEATLERAWESDGLAAFLRFDDGTSCYADRDECREYS